MSLSKNMKKLLLSCWFLNLVFTFVVITHYHKAVTNANSISSSTFSTTLHADWVTDLWIEALELIANFNKEAFSKSLLRVHEVQNPSELFSHPSIPEVYANFFHLALQSRQMSAKVQASFSDFQRLVKKKPLDACPFIFLPKLMEGEEEFEGIPTCELSSALTQFKRLREMTPDSGSQTSSSSSSSFSLVSLNQKTFGSTSSKNYIFVFTHPKQRSFVKEWEFLISSALDFQLILKFKPYYDDLNPSFSSSFQSNHTILPGFFCHLYIKDTEYKVIDDRNHGDSSQLSFNSSSSSSETNFQPLAEKETSTIGYKLLTKLTSLDEYVKVAANFPTTLPNFEDIKAPSSLIISIEKNSKQALQDIGMIASEGVVWINGKLKNADGFNWFQLLNDITNELELLNTIETLGLNKTMALKFLQINLPMSSSHLFNLSTLDHIIWLNDLEKDKRYQRWPKTLRSFLMPSMGLPKLAKNVFNLVFFMDLTHPGHIDTALDFVLNVRNNLPIRFGLVPMVDANPQSNRSKLGMSFYKIYLESGLVEAIKWLGSNSLSSPFQEMDASIYNNLYTQTQLFSIPLAGEFFLNGDPFPFTFNYKRTLSEKINTQLNSLMKWIFYSEIDEDINAASIFYSKSPTWNSRHPYAVKECEQYHLSSWNGSTSHGENASLLYVHVKGPVDEEIHQLFQSAQKQLSFTLEIDSNVAKEALLSMPELIVNGKNFGPLPKQFQFENLLLLFNVESETRLKPLLGKCPDCLKDKSLFWKLSSFWWYNRIRDMKAAASHLRQFGDHEGRIDPSTLFDCKVKGTCHTLPARKEEHIQLYALLDPITEFAQTLIPLFVYLTKSLDFVSFTVVWHSYTRKPLPNRFTRFVDPMTTDRCSFSELPSILYTLALDTPHAWGTFPVHSSLDLDNLILEQDHHAYFSLRHLLIEGHAEDVTSGLSPRGVQLILTHPEESPHAPEVQGTVVMANLGYFQLKASPGTYVLRFRPGRSADLFNPITQFIDMGQLMGVTLFPKLEKKLGKALESVLDPPKETWWNKLIGYVKPKTDSKTIHIFSVASGHLYERFLSIMMQSVKNHTTSPVKFWLIENFLSPSFKEFLPFLAKEIGFEFELVSFVWPNWLNKQTVKQRTIWGYKILFLDVLFPLSLNRIIFVDADQIVRTDLAELRDLDLQEKVYGYTPFCNSRPNMDNFRFWEQGYWKNHLNGKPYHISALYVIDLVRFRQLAAGDILRQHYQSLSNDPNSLANLDQDLPNALQQVLPIYSLPQEWLWCETWCDDASLANAKTIDLCNNPKTKEPKLDRARRLLPEWSIYDQRATELLNKFKSSQTPPPLHSFNTSFPSSTSTSTTIEREDL